MKLYSPGRQYLRSCKKSSQMLLFNPASIYLTDSFNIQERRIVWLYKFYASQITFMIPSIRSCVATMQAGREGRCEHTPHSREFYDRFLTTKVLALMCNHYLRHGAHRLMLLHRMWHGKATASLITQLDMKRTGANDAYLCLFATCSCLVRSAVSIYRHSHCNVFSL